MFKILKNKKGFTLVELIAIVALMVIVAGIATPSIYTSTARKQRSSAETDLQQMYRSSISCISDLAARFITPDSPYDRADEAVTDEYKAAVGNEAIVNIGTGNNIWYVEFEKQLVKKLYSTLIALDIDIFYYYPGGDSSALAAGSDGMQGRYYLRKPLNCNASERSAFVTAGNTNPYIVLQVVRIYFGESTTDFEIYLILSYHNDAKPFKILSSVKSKDLIVSGVKKYYPDLTVFDAYETNKGNDIVYSYRLR